MKRVFNENFLFLSIVSIFREKNVEIWWTVFRLDVKIVFYMSREIFEIFSKKYKIRNNLVAILAKSFCLTFQNCFLRLKRNFSSRNIIFVKKLNFPRISDVSRKLFDQVVETVSSWSDDQLVEKFIFYKILIFWPLPDVCWLDFSRLVKTAI